uniref:Uncharacterized protein n=1 Tax=Ditylenchus dipsaci TaxID=166011 RepID=A0A915EA64_9BILA
MNQEVTPVYANKPGVRPRQIQFPVNCLCRSAPVQFKSLQSNAQAPVKYSKQLRQFSAKRQAKQAILQSYGKWKQFSSSLSSLCGQIKPKLQFLFKRL